MAATDILTESEAREFAGGIDSTRYSTAFINAWIEGASKAMDRLVGPVVVRTLTDEAYDGGGHAILLRKWPVSSFTSVTEYDGTASQALTLETNAVKPAEAYYPEPYEQDPTLYDRTVRRRSSDADSLFPVGRGNVVVTYVAGRFADTASVDERFKKATGLLLQNLFRAVQAAPSQVGVSFEDVTPSFLPGFGYPRVVKALMRDEVQLIPGIA